MKMETSFGPGLYYPGPPGSSLAKNRKQQGRKIIRSCCFVERPTNLAVVT
jgi:hypothetical protein